jgi:hypothetical protein
MTVCLTQRKCDATKSEDVIAKVKVKDREKALKDARTEYLRRHTILEHSGSRV